ncbi:MAG: HU family DNA-binding protein [Thermodesulfobacteriota bacterium]
MLKKDLVDKVLARRPGYLKKDVAEAVEILLATMADAFQDGRRVEIRGFGSFSVRQRKARRTENPKTGKVMAIPARRNLHFTMGKSVKEDLVEDDDV